MYSIVSSGWAMDVGFGLFSADHLYNDNGEICDCAVLDDSTSEIIYDNLTSEDAKAIVSTFNRRNPQEEVK